MFCSLHFSASDVTSGHDARRDTRVQSKSSSYGRLLRRTPSPAVAAGVCRVHPSVAGS